MIKVKELNDRYLKLQEEFKAVTVLELREACKEIFAKYPNVLKLGWTQYAPHFNDGEPCEFSYHGMSVLETFRDPTEDEDYHGDDRDWIDDGPSLSGYPEVQELSDTIGSIPDDILKFIFGEDSKVIIDRDTITIEDYAEYHD